MATAIVGANWGDEGKGKMTDLLALDSDVIVRFQGGNNAGHTIINDKGRFALHILPSGVFNPAVLNIIGPGVALNIRALETELAELAEHGITPRIAVSDRAQVLFDTHKNLDAWEEIRLGKASFGSTKSGIAPFYADKYSKIGFQVCELFAPDDYILPRIKLFCDRKNAALITLYNQAPLDPADILAEIRALAAIVKPYARDTSALLRDAVAAKKRILLEGQLGALKDPDHGIYPMVTSSSPLAGFAAIGAGIPPYEIKDIICVVKAYSSAVGAGPFVSEIFDDEAQELRIRGGDKGEFGATTGRPRRMGWFDAVATRYGCQTQGATEIALTLVDALGYLDEVPVCVAYTLDGKRLDNFPTTPDLYRAKPVIEKLPGWKCDIRGARDWNALPQAARDYVKFIETSIDIPITFFSTGPGREDVIRLGKRK
ncbi:MAG: adenylosuccinate synthase [Kiritimatiellaeota bacterium]|nr:adenylosuccinate synthase [Kiritimatiellota bacterium]